MKTTNAIEPLTVALFESKDKSLSEKIEDFRQAMHEAELIPPSTLYADGKLHHFSTNGKPSDDAGWYLFNYNPISVGSFGCWRSGLTGSWCEIEEKKMTQEDRKKYKQAIQQMSLINDEEKAKANLQTAVNAQNYGIRPIKPHPLTPILLPKKLMHSGSKS